MTKIINKTLLILTIVFVLAMTGCLKDSDYSDNHFGTKNSQNQNFVEVHLTSSDNTNFVSRSYSALDHDTTVTKLIPINLTSGPASSDVTVTFALLDTISSAIVDTLVHHGDSIPNPAKYVVLNTGNKVTIPAGQSTGYISVKFKPADFIGYVYIFGIQITAISDPKYTISSLDKGFIRWSIKNQWDGDYTAIGVFDHPANGPRDIDQPKPLLTIDATTVQCEIGDLGTWFMNIKIDPVTYKVVSLTNVTNTNVLYFNTATTNIRGIPGGDSHYDPDTHKFYLYYYYNTGAPRVVTEVLTYEGPR